VKTRNPKSEIRNWLAIGLLLLAAGYQASALCGQPGCAFGPAQPAAAGSITNDKIASGAAISDGKLATISTPGKVADSALSANVPVMSGGVLPAVSGANLTNLPGSVALKIQSISADHQVLASETGTLFVVGTGGVTFTLPPAVLPQDGTTYIYCFFGNAEPAITINPSGEAAIIGLTGSATSVQANWPGNEDGVCIIIALVDTNEWGVVAAPRGTWTFIQP